MENTETILIGLLLRKATEADALRRDVERLTRINSELTAQLQARATEAPNGTDNR